LGADDIVGLRQGCPSGKILSPGEIACFLSHRRCWQIAADSSDPYTVICEDDIFLGREAYPILSRWDWIPAGAGLIKLETSTRSVMRDKQKVSVISGRSLFRLYQDTGSGCYITSRTAARELLRKTEKICDPVDNYLFDSTLPHSHGQVVLQLSPAVAIQEFYFHRTGEQVLHSSIHAERRERRRTGFEKFKREVVRPFEQAVKGISALRMMLIGSRRADRVKFE